MDYFWYQLFGISTNDIVGMKKIYHKLEAAADKSLRKMIASKYTFWLLFGYFVFDIFTLVIDFELIFRGLM